MTEIGVYIGANREAQPESVLNPSEGINGNPSALLLIVLSDTSFKLDWTIGSTNQTGHSIERSLDGINYAEIATVTGLTATYTDIGLTDFTTYYYRVRAYKESSYSDYCTPANSKTTSTRFITTWNTENAGSATKTIVIPTNSYVYDCYVDWGDGGAEQHVTGTISNITHVYTTAGIKTVKIRGNFPWIRFANSGDRLKILTIENWGNIVWGTNLGFSFWGCANLTANYTDVPDLSNTLYMNSMFRDCPHFNGSITNWNFSHVTSLSYFFNGCTIYTQPVANIDVSHVTDYSYMFANCTYFNQPLTGWNTSAAIYMNNMFANAQHYNQAVNHFNTANVTNMASMFTGAWSFNQPVSNFNTAKVTDMSNMFNTSYPFNQSVSNFDTSNVTSMAGMFGYCSAFNQSVSSFNTAKVTLMAGMFQGCTNFNQSVSNFDTSLVTNMSTMFLSCSSFNQPVSNFNTIKVTNMSNMFQGCTNFNQSVSNFDTSLVTLMSYMFSACSNFNQPVSNFNTSLVTSFISMFQNCASFKQSLAAFTMSAATSLTNMLSGCNINTTGTTTNYDATLISWVAQTLLPGKNFNAGISKYSAGAAATARGVLTSSPNLWTITDGGQA